MILLMCSFDYISSMHKKLKKKTKINLVMIEYKWINNRKLRVKEELAAKQTFMGYLLSK